MKWKRECAPEEEGRGKEGKQEKQSFQVPSENGHRIGTMLRGFEIRGRREYDTPREVVGSHDAKEWCPKERQGERVRERLESEV